MSLCGYKAFYRGKEIELYSDTIYHAQLDAAKQFGVKPNKSYMVHVVLCQRADGSEVIHIGM